jgi:phospholipase C
MRMPDCRKGTAPAIAASVVWACLCASSAGSASAGVGALTAAYEAQVPNAGPASVLTRGIAEIRPPARGKIQHVVVILQENRSFDNLFQGYPGSDTRSYGYDSNGTKITLVPVPLEVGYDIDHQSFNDFEACNGTGIPGTNCRMNGFNLEDNSCGGCTNPEYGYVPHNETTIYFNMAKQYVLGDRMFTSNLDASFVSHQYIIAGQASGAVDLPNGQWGCDGGSGDVVRTLTANRGYGSSIQACFDNTTIGDEIDRKPPLTWRFYASALGTDGDGWSPYQAIRHIRYGPDWSKDVISPQTRFFTDLGGGFLANVTWISPTCANSDHSGCGSNHGPAWVASIVNAIGKSPLWKSTAIFIYWDEWGGWYDHVTPPFLDYDGLGMRVPLLVISPYAKQNYVSHVQYEHGSIVRFIEDQFGLPRLAPSDVRAKSPATDCFNFSQSPRPFTPFASALTQQYFMHEPLDRRVPDAK